MMNRNKKKIIRRLILWVVALAALAALILFGFVPIYSEKEVSSGREPHLVFYEGDGNNVIIETFLLYMSNGYTTRL